MDKSTRKKIRDATQAGRTLLERSFIEQLEGTYDILLDGTIADQPGLHLNDREKVTREKLIAAVAHKGSTGLNAKESVEAYLREAAFTTLNRFVALKMLEARDLVQECVSKGEDSSGFKEFTALAPGLVAVEDKGYRLYIETIFDEIGQEVKVLFDRRDVVSLLWPDRQTLLELLGILNAPELSSVWAEDETIGWVYQYFNGDEERSQMRAESQAPRNSRELAVRNQFFTPRYVVQFLTDNTLGRTWYEMMQGETKLAHLDYLVRRPSEVFLAEGDPAPESAEDDSELSQEELLQQTVYVPFRVKKDPRDLRILDPACGSGHFLLYAFELLISIYEEAWSDAGAAAFTKTCTHLWDDYDSLDELRPAIPGLILRHNLHGVDIDPRAAQIAALALWMRAQRAYNQFDVGRSERPPITKTNIVVAEPMPGDSKLVEEFAASLKPAVLGDLFRKMVDEMKLAGELGSLLKIEESIAKAVKDAEETHRQGSLFAGETENQDFWDTADEKIIAALASFAASTAGSSGIRWQLFAVDAAQGVAFIELMRKRFDVVVMNPPFGAASLAAKSDFESLYPDSKPDIYAAFVTRGVSLAAAGLVGALTSRTGFFLAGLEKWRKRVLLSEAPISLLADLGDGVLDDALVEAAGYVLSPGTKAEDVSLIAIRLLEESSKSKALHKVIQELGLGDHSGLSVRPIVNFLKLPSSRISYSTPREVFSLFRLDFLATNHGLEVKFGLSTKDDARFIRTKWEVSNDAIVSDSSQCTDSRPWMLISKGGEYSLHLADIHLVAKWAFDGREIGARAVQRYPYLNGNPDWVLHPEVPYGKPGVTYSKRTTSGFSPRFLPSGCLISDLGCTIFSDSDGHLPAVLCIYGSRVFGYLLELNVASGDAVHSGSAARHYEIGTVGSIPVPSPGSIRPSVAGLAVEIEELKRHLASVQEERSEFSTAVLSPECFAQSIDGAIRTERSIIARSWLRMLEAYSLIEQEVRRAYAVGDEVATAIEAEFGPDVTTYPEVNLDSNAEFLWTTSLSDLTALLAKERGHARYVSKKVFVADRRLELLCHKYQAAPKVVVQPWLDSPVSTEDIQELSERVFSIAVGIVFGHLPDSALTADIVNELGWKSGVARAVLVADQGHSDDLLTVVVDAILDAKVRGIQSELCIQLAEVLRQTRDWAERSFFIEHITRYTKSRRRAPIYWQLATPSASYSVWCYYHRLNRDTFFRVATDYVTAKVGHEEVKLIALRQEAGPDLSSKQRKAIDAQETFVAELRAFKTEVTRIAPLWNPNLNDGVIINFAPLWRLVPQHKPWQKECKQVWDKLVKGDYDWAHLAMHLWPERVVPKCQDDRSLAIAHGLEDDFWYEDDDGKWQKRRISGDRIEELVAERASIAVKAALKDLLEAPAPAGRTRRKRRART